MISAAELDALVNAGATTAMIVAVVKVGLQEEEARLATGRAKDAERQRRHRESRGVVTHAESRVTDLGRAEKTAEYQQKSALKTPEAAAEREKERKEPKERKRESSLCLYTNKTISLVQNPESAENPAPSGRKSRRRTPAELAVVAEQEAAVLEAFEQFWLIYPRREGKGGAKKSFLSALKRGKPEEILVGAKRYASKRRGEDKQFTAMATTWLNQDRWLDEDGAAEQGVNTGPRWEDVKAAYVEKYGGQAAFKAYCRDLDGEDRNGNIVDFPGVKKPNHLDYPDEGEEDALVCRDDQGSQGRACQEEPRASGLLDILPALQAMDYPEEN